MKTVKQCMNCNCCDINDTNDLSQVKCKKFNTYVDLWSRCDYFDLLVKIVCKDRCLCYEACGMKLKDRYDNCTSCDCFLDKQEYKYVPCKIGDTVYFETEVGGKPASIECTVKEMNVDVELLIQSDSLGGWSYRGYLGDKIFANIRSK